MFVFRNMSYPKHAEEAIKKINEKEICGQSIIVEPSRKMIPRIHNTVVHYKRVNNQRRSRYYHTHDKERERERASTPRKVNCCL